MTTYHEAADSAFSRIIYLTGNQNAIYLPPNNGFWQQGNALSTCIEYLVRSKTPDNQNIVKNALDFVFDNYRMNALDNPQQWIQEGRYDTGSWLDDYGWWGIALQQAYQFSNQLGYDNSFCNRLLHVSQNCWIALQGGWDPSPVTPGPGITGGAWNHQTPDFALSGRNCITNEALWLLSQYFRQSVPGDPKYVDQNKASYGWFSGALSVNALFDQDGLVRERLVGMEYYDPSFVWTGDQGMFIAACRGNQSAGGGDAEPLARQIAQSVSMHLIDNNGVLHDRNLPSVYVTDFSKDYATGKGVLLRCLSAWCDSPNPPSDLRQLILNNAQAVWNNRLFKDEPPDPNDPTKQYQFGFNWNPKGNPPPPNGNGEPDFPNNDSSLFSQLILQVAGMSALNAALIFAADEPIPD
jgi:hypothetical protein